MLSQFVLGNISLRPTEFCKVTSGHVSEAVITKLKFSWKLLFFLLSASLIIKKLDFDFMPETDILFCKKFSIGLLHNLA